ncbi:AF4/FMR2 family member 1 isoform X1 [Peromyscus leucopus]|uniref:AF4/FMR2 family member 1 isoform X1 n=1 Tax=Peromyscus leucopus TaxID=10041 RepID=UPI0018849062|nr:AF4/FMR2 family member 1 isoform X1 [Peromyscus leucopus]
MAFKDSSSSSLYNEDRNLLRIREKERRNQEAHQEKEVFAEKTPLFGEPYKTAKGDELSSRIQNMLGDYEEMKEFLSAKSCPQRLDGSEDRPGKPRYPPFHDRAGSLAPLSFRTHVYHHQPVHTSSAPGSLSVGNVSHSPKRAPPRMESVPGLHAKHYGPPDSQRLTQDRLSQEGHCSSHRKCDRRADGGGDSAPPEMKLSPLISSLPSPVPPLSPVHSRLQGPGKARGGGGSSSSSKSYCAAASSKDLVAKVQDSETAHDSLVAVTSLGVAPPQTFPPPPLPSKSVVAMQQKPTAYVRPMDGQDQAPNESPELKPPLEDYGQQSFEKPDAKVPAKAKLTRLRMPSQTVEQTLSNEVHCVEEILKEMTHSWPPPLTAIHTPSTAEPSRFPFPTKDPLHVSTATQSQKQYDTPSKTHPSSQQGTSMLEDDLQLSDSEESDIEQAAEKPPSPSAPPSAPQTLPEPVVSAHSSGAESESSASDSSSDSESESSSSDSEENGDEPLETPAPEPEPPTTNKWQLDNWLTKVSQPSVPLDCRGNTESPRWRQESKDGERSSDQQHPESKDPPPKSSSKALRGATEGPQPGKRSCQKSPAQQEPPPRQTTGAKQPRKPAKGSSQAEPQANVQVDGEPGPFPYGSKEQTSKDKPKVKTKGRPRAVGNREPKPEAPAPKPQAVVPKPQAAGPTPNEKRKHKSSPAPSKALSGPQPPKDNAGDRNPEHFALVTLSQSQGPPHGGRGGSGVRTSGCRQAVIVQEDGRKDRLLLPLGDTKLLSPLRDAPPPTSLVVKITLDLLTRIPQPPGKGGRPRKAEDRQLAAAKKPDSEKRSCVSPSRGSKKRKQADSEKDHDNKRVRLEKEVQPHCAPSSSHPESSKTKTPRPSSESSRKEMLPPPPVPSSSSSSSSSSQKSTKTAHKRSKPDADTCSQDPPKSASSTKNNSKDPSVPKHRKVQARGSEYKGSSGEAANPFPVPSLPNGNCKPGKPQVKPDRQQADSHMKEAKKLKCKAEAMADKAGKAFKYLEAVLSYIECGMATESESSAKLAYAVYSETVDLIKFTMSLKSFSDTTAPAQEKIFAVLCLRCQSLVNMAMFRCKKDVVMKYSRTLSDHFKSSSKAAQAPSPCMARSTGVPSPLSPTPSPASSVGSQSSAGSMGSSGGPATISTPVTIQNMTSSYVTITSHVLKAFDLWEQAEALTKKNKEFFAQLSTKVRVLALNSSLVDLVHYTRQGLQRLKQAPKAP